MPKVVEGRLANDKGGRLAVAASTLNVSDAAEPLVPGGAVGRILSTCGYTIAVAV